MLGHETILDKFDSTEIISSILSTRWYETMSITEGKMGKHKQMDTNNILEIL